MKMWRNDINLCEGERRTSPAAQSAIENNLSSLPCLDVPTCLSNFKLHFRLSSEQRANRGMKA